MLFYELCVPCKISVLYKMLTGLDLTFSGGGAGGHKNAGRGGVWQGPGAGCGAAGRAELLNTVSSPAQLHHYTRPQQPATSTSCNAAAHWPLVPGPQVPGPMGGRDTVCLWGQQFPDGADSERL